MTTRFALTVRFAVTPGHEAAFRAAILANAADSVRQEPGCLRFDVLTSHDGTATEVLLYEIYADRAAFDRHLVSRHFLDFDVATRPMVIAKTVEFFHATEHAKA